jgi:hypothetical protein
VIYICCVVCYYVIIRCVRVCCIAICRRIAGFGREVRVGCRVGDRIKFCVETCTKEIR